MFYSPRKMHTVLLITVFVIFSAIFVGCGDSQGVATLNACLSEFSELVEDYKTSVNADKTKQAEWDAKVALITEKWTNIRNEFGSDITPQHMDKMVQQYDDLLLSLSNFRKTIGS